MDGLNLNRFLYKTSSGSSAPSQEILPCSCRSDSMCEAVAVWKDYGNAKGATGVV